MLIVWYSVLVILWYYCPLNPWFYSAVHICYTNILEPHTQSLKALEFSFWKSDMFWRWILLVPKGLDEWGLYHVADASVYESSAQASGRRRSDKKKHRTIRLEIVNFWTNSNSKTWIKDILGNKIPNNDNNSKFRNFPTGGDRYIHTYIHTYLPTYLPTYTHRHTYRQTYIHTYIPTYLHTYIPTYLPTYLNTYLPYLPT